MTKNSKIAIIITAAGSSTRMGGGIKKEYLPLKNGTVLSNCAVNFLNAINQPYTITNLVFTHPANGQKETENALLCDSDFISLINKKPKMQVSYVQGGTTRQNSVYNALVFLNNLKDKPDYVLIHDGARPFVTSKIITDVIEAMIEYKASVPGLTPVDTQKEIDENGMIIRHLKRDSLTAVQTPQGFEFEKLFLAHTKAQNDDYVYTDDTEIWGNYFGRVKVVEGDIINKKITFPGDL